MKKQVATVSMTTHSEAGGEKIMQSHRGGNVPVPARVEVEIKTGHQTFRVTIEVDEEGRVKSHNAHVFPGIKQTRELPKAE